MKCKQCVKDCPYDFDGYCAFNQPHADIADTSPWNYKSKGGSDNGKSKKDAS